MAFQEFELNMIPHGDMPSFYASQYETGRPIIIDVLMGEDAFDCSELFIELHCRKVDDNIVTLEPDSVDGNQVTFVGTEQLFACPGKNLCELCLYADETKDTSLGSLNFFIEVEPDPMSGGLTSETQIYNLTQQIEEISQEVIGEDYYDKTEVDNLLDLKADKATTYTKTEVDNALNLKADKSDTYTKTQVDSALALKANSSDLATVATTGDYDDLLNKPTIPAAQVQSDYAQADNTKVDYIKNKPDLSIYATNDGVASLIYDLLPVGSASGAVANFTTEIGNVNLVDCKANIVASQASGTPTPSSPLAISGYTSLTLTRCGVNLWDEVWEVGGYNNSTGVPTPDVDRIRNKNKIPCKGGMSLKIVYPSNLSGGIYVYAWDSSDTLLNVYYENTDNQFIITTPSNTAYINFNTQSYYGTTYNNDISINYPSTDTSYHAYDTNSTTYAVSWQTEAGTVYGGNIDLTTGLLTVTWLGKTYTGDANENWVMHGSGSASAFAMRSSVYLNIDINELPKADYLQGISRNVTWGNFDNWVSVTSGKQIVTGIQSITSVTDWADYLALNPLTVIWKAETPVTYQLTPVQVEQLLGENNIYNDTNGDTEVKYKDSIQHYIDTRV